MKKDGISNLLRRKCSRFELNLHSLMAEAGILLRLDRNHGGGAADHTSGGK
jgi:hypothetical protein